MIIKSSADFAGTGTPVALSTILGVKKCKWFQVVGLTVAGEPGRVGESDIAIDVVSPYAAGKGAPVVQSGGQFAPPIALAMEFYDLTAIYVLFAVGDIGSAQCAI